MMTFIIGFIIGLLVGMSIVALSVVAGRGEPRTTLDTHATSVSETTIGLE